MGYLGDMFSMMIYSSVQSFFVDLLEDAVQVVAVVLVEIMGTAQQVLDYPIVVQGILYAQGLAFAVMAAKVAGEALRTYILHSSGDAEANPGGLLIDTAKAAAVIGSVPWLVRWLYLLGTQVAVEISGLGGVSEPVLTQFVRSVEVLPLVLILVGLIALVLIVLIYIQTFIRAAHLGMLAVIGPLLAIQLVGGDHSLFNLWLKELIVVSFSQALQIFMLMAALYALGGMMTGNPITSLLMFAGWLWSTMKAPSILKQMLYSSGLGRVAGGAAQTAGTMIIVRKMMTRGA